MENEDDLSLYSIIRLEDKKGNAYGDAAFNSSKDKFSSDHIRRCVRTLLNHKVLKEAFDPLLENRGLSQGMRFSTLHKLCCAKADEEAAAYLHYTFNTWLKIALGSSQALDKVDVKDVRALELRCPQLSSQDTADITEMIDHGHIFVTFSQEERVAIKRNVLSIDYVIPSLSTFFQDVHLLEICAASMRHIVTPTRKMTIRETLKTSFGPPMITHSPINRFDDSFDSAMERLWVCIVGAFQRMPPPNLGTASNLLAGYFIKEPDVGVLSAVAQHARNLGFKTPEIERLSQLTVNSEYPVNPMAETESQLANLVLQDPNLAAFLIGRQHINKSFSRSGMKSSASYARVLRRRCGRPRHDLYQEDTKFLITGLIHLDFGALNLKSQDISSFQILRSQCLSFFSHSKEVNRSVLSKPPADITYVLERSSSFQSKYQEEERTREKTENDRVQDYNNTTTPHDQHVLFTKTTPMLRTSSLRPTRDITSKTFKFIEYQEGQFKTFQQIYTNSKDEIIKAATHIIRDHGMSLYNLNCTPLLVEECYDSTRNDLNNILLLPTSELVITNELKNAAAVYRRKEEFERLEELRRH